MAGRRDGTVWSWGTNETGQFGDGATANAAKPVRVGKLKGVAAIAAGPTHALAAP